MTTAEKIDALLHFLGMTPSQFAQNIGYDNAQMVYDLRHGKTKSFTKKAVENIRKAFPQVNPMWLLADEENIAIKPEIKRIYVPLLNIDSVGGLHRVNSISDTSPYLEGYVEYENAQEGDIAIHQSGESMLPDISSNNVLVIRELPNWEEYFGYGRIFVLELKDGQRLTKRVLKSEKDPKKYVLCESINPNYVPEELPRNLIQAVWLVLRVRMDINN